MRAGACDRSHPGWRAATAGSRPPPVTGSASCRSVTQPLIAGCARDNVVRARIASYLEPAAASRPVIPELVVRPAGVVAQVHVVDPRGLRCIGRRTAQRCVAAVRELDLVA